MVRCLIAGVWRPVAAARNKSISQPLRSVAWRCGGSISHLLLRFDSQERVSHLTEASPEPVAAHLSRCCIFHRVHGNVSARQTAAACLSKNAHLLPRMFVCSLLNQPCVFSVSWVHSRPLLVISFYYCCTVPVWSSEAAITGPSSPDVPMLSPHWPRL